jgi:hypothetical protein
MILTASFVPNPATSGETFVLRVMAADLTGESATEERYVNEFYAGEV